MTPSENIYRSDRDEVDADKLFGGEMAQYYDDEWIDVDDGMIDVESFGEMIEDFHEDDCYDDSMDGDFDSAMRDAGFGTDEDYGYYGEE